MKRIFDEATTLDLLSEIQSQLLDYEPTVAQSMVINGQARYLRWDFTKLKLDQLELIQITDIQYGHKACNISKLQEYLSWVLADEARYIILGGDLVDAGHVQSKGSPFEQIGDPQAEIWEFCRLFAPVRHRIIGYVGGNHERRSLPTFGDLGKSIATILKVPYSPGKQHIDVTFGKHKPFKISAHHSGQGGGSTPGALANGLARFMAQSDSQLYLLGHLHQAMTIPANREVRDGKGGMELVKIMGARGSSFLEYYGTYAEVILATTPQAILMPRAVLDKDGGWSLTLR